MTLITVSDLTIGFDRQPLIENISFSVPRGRCVCLTGPSGCGKTTLLKTIAGLRRPDHGRIDTHGIHPAFVFQEPRLLPWCTVRENIALAAPDSAGVNDAIDHWLDRMHLSAADAAKYPDELSGGMSQRVAMARALMLSADLIVMDEPFSALDAHLRRELQLLTRDLVTREHISVLLVTHDKMEALRMADTVLRLTGNPARLSARLDLPPCAGLRSDTDASAYFSHSVFAEGER